MNFKKPYIYKITKKDTGEFYIGSQCRGLEIGKNYFTSACGKNNKWLVEDFQKNTSNYIIEIINSYDDPAECVLKENFLIKENFSNPLNLNESYCVKHVFTRAKFRTEDEILEHKKMLAINANRRAKQYYFSHRNKVLDYSKKYREKHKESIKEKHKKYDAEHKEENKTYKHKWYENVKNTEEYKNKKNLYNKEHKEENKIYKHEWYEKRKNTEEFQLLAKQYRIKNKQHKKEYDQQYREKNKEEIQLKNKITYLINKCPALKKYYSSIKKQDKKQYRELFNQFKEKNNV